MGKNIDFIVVGLLLLAVGCSQSGTPHNAKLLYMSFPEGEKLLDTEIGRMQSGVPVEWIIDTRSISGYDKQLFVPMVISKGSLSFSLPCGEQKIILLPDGMGMVEVAGKKYGPYIVSGRETKLVLQIRNNGEKLLLCTTLCTPDSAKIDPETENFTGRLRPKGENFRFKILIEKSEDFEGKIGPSKYYTPIWR